MTNPTGARSDDPNWLVHQLQTDITETTDHSDLPADATPDEEWAATALTNTNVEYPAVVEAAADSLIRPVMVSPDARQRFIAAAERALAVRRAELGPLPVFLAAARKRAGLTLDDVQAQINQAAAEISASDLETGQVSIQEAGQPVTAIWIHAVRADRKQAREACARSLDADLGGELRPAAGTRTVRKETAAWLAALDTQLDSIEGREQ